MTDSSMTAVSSDDDARALVTAVQRLYRGTDPAELIYNHPHMLNSDEAATVASSHVSVAHLRRAATPPSTTPTSLDMARRVATMMRRLDHLAQPRTQTMILPRAVLMELTDIIRHGLILALPHLQPPHAAASRAGTTSEFVHPTTPPATWSQERVGTRVFDSPSHTWQPPVQDRYATTYYSQDAAQTHKQEMKMRFHACISARRVSMTAVMEGLYTLTYVSVKLRLELVLAQLQRRLQEELSALSHSTSAVPHMNNNNASLALTSSSSAPFNEAQQRAQQQQQQQQLLPEQQARSDSHTVHMSAAHNASESTLLSLMVTQILVDDLSSVYDNMLLLLPLCGDGAMSASRATQLMPALMRYYYQLADWVLRVEDSTLSMYSAHPPAWASAEEVEKGASALCATPMLTRVTRVDCDERRGVVTVHLHRPTLRTPWGLLFTQQGTLLDVDAIMRLQPRARELHALLATTTFGAHVIAVNEDRIVAPSSVKRCASTTSNNKNNTTNAYFDDNANANNNLNDAMDSASMNIPAGHAARVIQSIAEHSAHRKTLQLTLRSHAFRAAVQRAATEVAFVVSPQGGESTGGQRASILLHRRSATTAWSFTLRDAHRPTPAFVSRTSEEADSACNEHRVASTHTNQLNGTMRTPLQDSTNTLIVSTNVPALDTHNSTAGVSPMHRALPALMSSASTSSSSASLLNRSPHRVVLWQPPPSRALSPDARAFVRRFAGRLCVYAMNGVEVRSAAQGAALAETVETVLLDLVVLPARRSSHTQTTTSYPAPNSYSMRDSTTSASLQHASWATGMRSNLDKDVRSETLVHDNNTINAQRAKMERASGEIPTPGLAAHGARVHKTVSEETNTKHVVTHERPRAMDVNHDVPNITARQRPDTRDTEEGAEEEEEIGSAETTTRRDHRMHASQSSVDAQNSVSVTDNNCSISGSRDTALPCATQDIHGDNEWSRVERDASRPAGDVGAAITSQMMSQLASMSTSADAVLHGWPNHETRLSHVQQQEQTSPPQQQQAHSTRDKAHTRPTSHRSEEQVTRTRNHPNKTGVRDGGTRTETTPAEATTSSTTTVLAENNKRQRRHRAAVHTALTQGRRRGASSANADKGSTEHSVGGSEEVKKLPLVAGSRNDAAAAAAAGSTKRCTLANNVELLSLNEESMTLRRESLEKPWGLPIECSSSATASRHGLPLRLLRLPEPRPSCATHPFVRAFAKSASTWYIAEVNGRRATDAKTMLKFMSRLKKMSIKFIRK